MEQILLKEVTRISTMITEVAVRERERERQQVAGGGAFEMPLENQSRSTIPKLERRILTWSTKSDPVAYSVNIPTANPNIAHLLNLKSPKISNICGSIWKTRNHKRITSSKVAYMQISVHLCSKEDQVLDMQKLGHMNVVKWSKRIKFLIGIWRFPFSLLCSNKEKACS